MQSKGKLCRVLLGAYANIITEMHANAIPPQVCTPFSYIYRGDVCVCMERTFGSCVYECWFLIWIKNRLTERTQGTCLINYSFLSTKRFVVASSTSHCLGVATSTILLPALGDVSPPPKKIAVIKCLVNYRFS